VPVPAECGPGSPSSSASPPRPRMGREEAPTGRADTPRTCPIFARLATARTTRIARSMAWTGCPRRTTARSNWCPPRRRARVRRTAWEEDGARGLGQTWEQQTRTRRGDGGRARRRLHLACAHTAAACELRVGGGEGAWGGQEAKRRTHPSALGAPLRAVILRGQPVHAIDLAMRVRLAVARRANIVHVGGASSLPVGASSLPVGHSGQAEQKGEPGPHSALTGTQAVQRNLHVGNRGNLLFSWSFIGVVHTYVGVCGITATLHLYSSVCARARAASLISRARSRAPPPGCARLVAPTDAARREQQCNGGPVSQLLVPSSGLFVLHASERHAPTEMALQFCQQYGRCHYSFIPLETTDFCGCYQPLFVGQKYANTVDRLSRTRSFGSSVSLSHIA